MKSTSRKPTRYPVETLTSSEIGSLLNACSSTSTTGRRNRALIVVLWRGGLRISEALALQPKDITHGNVTVLQVLHGKGDKARQVAIDPLAGSILAAHVGSRTTGHVFQTASGQPLLPSYVRQLFPRLALRAGIKKRCHPHQLRHVFACELMRERLPMNLISRALGHNSIATTAKYLAHVSMPELEDAMQARAIPEALRIQAGT